MVIADKSPLVQTGLGRLFGEDDRFTLLATATDGERFMEAVDRLSFDIGVIGWNMPYMDGRAVLQALRERADPPRIVVYTGNAAPEVPATGSSRGSSRTSVLLSSAEQLMEISTKTPS